MGMYVIRDISRLRQQDLMNRNITREMGVKIVLEMKGVWLRQILFYSARPPLDIRYARKCISVQVIDPLLLWSNEHKGLGNVSLRRVSV